MKIALAVGINDYKMAPLNGCINDAISVTNVLATNEDKSPNFDVKLETNITTKASLKKMVQELFAKESTTALFYFSGHGIVNELGGYIVTPDYMSYDEGISMDELLLLANKSKAKEKIIILDCCYSGALGSPELLNKTTSLSQGTTILSASRDNEPALEVNGHGMFTSLLLEALNGGAADLLGSISSASVYAYVEQALGAWQQRPIFKSNISNLSLLRSIKPKVPLGVLRKITTYFPTVNFNLKLNPTFEFSNKKVADPANVKVFQNLQLLTNSGLVSPVDENHMYWVAQHSKACKLTVLGHHYWRLVKENRI